ncbi:MAG TPA: Gfo/Idh/MocA family oxidoreductase [Candidatus Saccharimonadales bacterium]|nr:Gfo/Idh/MocA family oxidoreductase [Candidatus Saccharimonadales bacterium]
MIQGALFGAGNIAQRGHLQALNSDPALATEMRITSCCDLASANLEAVRSRWPEIRTYPSAPALWAAEKPDFVDICTPPDSHAALLREAVARRAHIFCEKPLCRSSREAQELDRLVRGAPLVFLPGHQYHHAPPWRAVAEAVRAGEIGGLRLVEWTVWRREANPGNSAWSPAWRTDPAVGGGGILMDHGAHVVYQLRSLLGDPVAVTARLQRLRPDAYPVEDTASVIFEYPAAVARLGFTWASPLREITQRLVGSQGEIRVLDDRIVLARDGTERELKFDAGMSANSSHAEWFVPLFREFAARVRRRDYARDGWEEAVASQRTLEACYRSAAEGCTVRPAEPQRVPA